MSGSSTSLDALSAPALPRLAPSLQTSYDDKVKARILVLHACSQSSALPNSFSALVGGDGERVVPFGAGLVSPGHPSSSLSLPLPLSFLLGLVGAHFPLLARAPTHS